MTTSDETAFPDRVARVLEPGLDVLDAVDRVIAACVEATSAIEAGIVIADRFGTLQVLASTSERSSEAEEAQLGTDEGSCLDCYRTGTTVDVADVSTHESEWPAFVTTMRDRGLQGTFAEPIRLRDRTIGSLCVFADHTRGHSDEDVVLIRLLADAASAALVRQRDRGGPVTIEDRVEDALGARVLVEQAKGALAYRRGIRMDEAFQLLRRAAADAGRSLRALAEDVVHRGADLSSTG
ncbi:GAF and ANTAR domain-containing protein [Curtobacterium poinsettiae]|uniref:GAF and ANTAR domain-containing protein n=1 Tax=Curtobacterium poinsettiae TaxID=159612 RepID=UPI002362E08A|nr:GAF and ANTAR domain-containing protein [Curtobacterium flaccumfaciens]MDD1385505.1 GAF and ANTAR domain-containing protein [Curtobacterium flaccumfaciens pv. poinsettiae]